ncbi:hypothetical protein AGMMS49587_08090 [Spirochaetia bacterium]|nr:hypothetical protein AGMMS49587_08090 [Spirochaetia bacterium]
MPPPKGGKRRRHRREYLLEILTYTTTGRGCGYRIILKIKEYLRPRAGNLAAGANIAGFLRVADAMIAQGVV